MRAVFALVLALAFLAASRAPAAQPSQDGPPAWLSGYWLSCEGEVQTAETWMGGGDSVMLGANIETNKTGGAFEFFRIASNARGGISYYAMPGGRSPATEFSMIEQNGRRVVFSNPAHDFPQRVIYVRDVDTLRARIEGRRNGKDEHMDWTFHRAAFDQKCR